MKTLIVIPTKNSEKYILDVIAEIEIISHDLDYLIVDYGSSDKTRYLLQNNDVPRLELPLETTYYRALSLGMMYASQNGYDAVVEFDDKGLFIPEDINYLISTYKNLGCDYVFTSRFLTNKKKYKWEKSRILRFVIFLTTGKKITDPMMRFKLYGKIVVDFFGKDGYYEPSIDRVVQTLRNGLLFKEVSTTLNKPEKQKQFVIHKWKQVGWKLAMILSILFVRPFGAFKKEIKNA